MTKIKLCIAALACALFPCLSSSAQEQVVNNSLYLTRYKLLVSKVGDCGMGVLGFLDKWEAADSSDINMMIGRFNYYLAKCTRDTVVRMDVQTYLGNKPVLSLKDSSGRNINYFSEKLYDDTLFAKSLKWLDKAIEADNTRMELFVARANALARYEKGSPDMTVQYLCKVIDRHFTGKSRWKYYDRDLTAEVFDEIIQDYCYTFFKTGTASSYEAFRCVSERMLRYEPQSNFFLDNMGSYWLVVKGNYSKAKKYYSKSLKVDPEDAAAKKNMEILQKLSVRKK